jgi:hypothetical protein
MNIHMKDSEPVTFYFANHGANVTITIVCEDVDTAERLRAAIDDAIDAGGVRLTVDKKHGFIIEGRSTT